MSIVIASALAGAAAATLVGLPRPGRLRVEDLAPHGGGAAGPRRPARALLAVPAAAALTVGLLMGPAVAVLLGAGAATAAYASGARARRRAVVAEQAGAVHACGALAAELRAGRAPADALAAASAVAAGPLREVLRTTAAAAGLGGDVAAGLRVPPAGTPTAVPEVLRALAACWSVCATSGSGLAAAVERLEEALRAEQAQRRALDAELAGPRASAGLLAVLPLAGLAMAAGLGADPWQVLLHTPLGLACLTLGLALDGAGVWWTSRLVARASGTR